MINILVYVIIHFLTNIYIYIYIRLVARSCKEKPPLLDGAVGGECAIHSHTLEYHF